MNIWDIPFSEQQPTSPMHWIVGSKEGSFVVESTKDGLKVYDNNWGVLTNAPTFDWMSYNMANYVNLTRHEPTIQFAPDMKGIDLFSRGLGSSGLPGGVDSVSRFVRVAFTNLNSVCDPDPQKTSPSFSTFYRMCSKFAAKRKSNRVSLKSRSMPAASTPTPVFSIIRLTTTKA